MKFAHTSQTMAKNGQKADLIVLLTFHCETKFMKSDTVQGIQKVCMLRFVIGAKRGSCISKQD